ncbi:chymotrypsin inhibitor-like [Andrena cerasifolii]|uniref:chymotrypsin inhibitor-like n=1 Tax=Andrena cerasifolii TaxID=2819439 RepID=UPI0040378EBA
MSRYTIVLLGLFAVVVAVYAEIDDGSRRGIGRCHEDNESWNICGTRCEPTCSRPVPPLCVNIPCTIKTTAGCRCDVGYVRDTDGSCVLRRDCQKQQNQEEDPRESAE